MVCAPATWLCAWPNTNHAYQALSDGHDVHDNSLLRRLRERGGRLHLSAGVLAALERLSAAGLPAAEAHRMEALQQRGAALVSSVGFPIVDSVLARL